MQRTTRRSLLPGALIGLGLCFGIVLQAAAHAIVVAAVPAANARVAGPDVPIDLRFNSRLDTLRSRLILLDAAGHKRLLPVTATPEADRMQATATGLAPGVYRLEWYALSADGHITRGVIRFTVQTP